jgi:hypothetical protein
MQRGTFLKKTGNAQYASHSLPSLNREGAMLSGGVSSRLSSLSIRSFGALCGEKEAIRHVDDPQFDIQWRRQKPWGINCGNQVEPLAAARYYLQCVRPLRQGLYPKCLD